MIPRFSPTQLNRLARQLLEDSFALVEVEAEIGTFKPAASGHWYFVLKDAQSELRAVMYRSRASLVRFKPEAGARVVLRGRLTLFEARGEYQLLAEWMEPAGLGAQLLALRRLREQLAAEGLFADARKRVLPPRPRIIAVLTSPQGAALHDVLSVLRRRFPLVCVELWPIPVQGGQSAQEVVATLQALYRSPHLPDVLLLTRGGGSKEDLQLFDDEWVCRTVAASPIPTVAAIGHEIDVTTVELVADLRAATPSVAAERLVPDARQLAAHLAQLRSRSARAVPALLNTLQQRLDHAFQRLERAHPSHRLQAMAERLHWLRQSGARTCLMLLSRARERLHHAQQRLLRHDPRLRLARVTAELSDLRQRLRQHVLNNLAGKRSHLKSLELPRQHAPTIKPVKQRLERARERLLLGVDRRFADHSQRLDVLRRNLYLISPQATLERGYVLVFGRLDERVRSSAHELGVHEPLRLAFHDGDRNVRVEA